MRDHDLATHFLERHPTSGGERVSRRRQQDDLVEPERHGLDSAIRRLKRQDAEVERSVEQCVRHLPRRDATDLHGDARVSRREAVDVRQQGMDGRFVGADDDPPAPDLLELPDRQLGLAGQSEQALGVVLKQPAGLGQRAVARGAVEQPLAELILDAPDRLADGRLGPVEPAGRRREAVIGRNREKCRQILQLHKIVLI